MHKVYSIGEILIDFIEEKKDNYKANPGGAPANVSALVKRLGGVAGFIGSISNDNFGNELFNLLVKESIDTSLVSRVNNSTMLAFVKLDSNNDRSFVFYNENTADKFLDINKVDNAIFDKDILHFCSVSLSNENNRSVHKSYIDKIKSSNGVISFDPNLRFNLWKDLNELKSIVYEFINYADILKLSEEEVEFLFDKNEDKAINKIFETGIKILFITRGDKGATVIINNQKRYDYRAPKVNVVDTTGAGDAFIGSVLFTLQNNKIDIRNLLEHDYEKIIKFACDIASMTVQNKGAISSYIFE